ncbi:MAG: hypothetical protein ACI8SE_001780, partial [Bacteroidia bacterium]
WSFEILLPFATSSANYIDFYLWSDTRCFDSNGNGYFVRIGGTNDAFVLFKKQAGKANALLISEKGLTHSLSGVLKCVQQERGQFILSFYDVNKSKFTWKDSVPDLGFDSSGYMGFSIQQSTPSFHQKHYFDNLYYGPVRKDSTPPNVTSLSVQNDSLIIITVNEPIDNLTIATSNFVVQPIGINPITLQFEADTIYLDFSQKFITGNYSLQISNLSDTNGNTEEAIEIPFIHVYIEDAGLNDVLVSEIYPDYSPGVSLPPFEYIEITNRSDKIVNLNGWEIADVSKTSTLPEYVLWPDSILILCDEKNEDAFRPFGSVLGVPNLISLNNASDSLWLKNENGIVVHHVFYSNSWHKQLWKAEGGWSLEMIDLDYPCTLNGNWASSTHTSGGTPGRRNAVRTTIVDIEPPRITTVQTRSDYVVLTFDESLSLYAPLIEDFYSDELWLGEVTKYNEFQLLISFKISLDTGKLYHLEVTSVHDCKGNTIESLGIDIGIGKKLEVHDLVLNEVMYDVSEACVEFIEIYNATEYLINLNDLYMGVLDSNNFWERLYPVTDKSNLLLPLRYAVCCTDTTLLKRCKPNATNMVASLEMPRLVNGHGNIGISTNLGIQIDKFYYSDDYHFPLISDTRDVSLERLNPSARDTTWLSATSIHNYATPGFRNAHIMHSPTNSDVIEVMTDPVSPDGDGYNDNLVVGFTTKEEKLVHLRIYDLVGRLVAFPLNTSLAAGQNQVLWNCLSADGELVPSGIYVIDLQGIDLEGRKTRARSVFTVVRE